MTLLIEHPERVIARCSEFDAGFDDERFIFSYTADHTRPCSPSGVTHRYARMVDKLGIHTHLHAIRHYSATELLASGVDLRTVAGRLGHGSGGATTLKVYAAWVARADQQASELLAARLPVPRPPVSAPAPLLSLTSGSEAGEVVGSRLRRSLDRTPRRPGILLHVQHDRLE